jgi:hypothetical protein
MKKISFLSGIIFLLISGCQYIPILLPTLSVSNQNATNTSVGEETVLPSKTLSAPVSATQAPTLIVTPIPILTLTPNPVPFITQPGSPAYIQNFAHIDAGCDWLGVAGQIFDANNKPINNLVVNIKGKLGQTEIDTIALTGIPEANVYGPGGYEIILSDKAENSENSLMVQIFDINGNKLSNAMTFLTYSDCKKNLMVINFVMQ